MPSLGSELMFEGIRFLIVEDEPLVGIMLQDMIEDLGGEVAAWAETLEDATRLASSQEPDVAILDINLKGEPSYAAARILAERDRPFFFVTGFAHVDVPECLSGVPVVAKPYTYRCIGAAVEKVLGAGAPGGSPA